MAYCEICEMDNCADHGPRQQRRRSREAAAVIQVSPRNIAHFEGCPHKDDPDMGAWGEVRGVANAWTRIGNREVLRTTGGVDREVRRRCEDCVEHGPWY